MTPRTRAIVRVHPSNFAVVGFTERPSASDVAAVAQKHNLLLIEDAGAPSRRILSIIEEPIRTNSIRTESVRAQRAVNAPHPPGLHASCR